MANKIVHSKKTIWPKVSIISLLVVVVVALVILAQLQDSRLLRTQVVSDGDEEFDVFGNDYGILAMPSMVPTVSEEKQYCPSPTPTTNPTTSPTPTTTVSPTGSPTVTSTPDVSTLSEIPNNLSAVAVNPGTDTFYALRNDPPTMYRYNLDGTYLGTINLSGFDDTEGIVSTGTNQLAIVEEGLGGITIVTIDAGTTTLSKSDFVTINIDFPLTDSNFGFEGVAYNAALDEFYVGVEKPIRVLVVARDGSTYEPFDTQAVLGGIMTDISDVSYDPVSGNLFVLSDESSMFAEVTLTGTLVAQTDVSAGHPQPEGLFVGEDIILIAGEPNTYQRISRTGGVLGSANVREVKVAQVFGPTVTPSVCEVGTVAPAPNSYRQDKRAVRERASVRDNLPGEVQARDILLAICKGRPAPPGCPVTAPGCATWRMYDSRGLPVTLFHHGLVKKAANLWRYAAGTIITNLNPKVTQEAPALYAVAPRGREDVRVTEWMSLWELDDGAMAILGSIHPTLPRLAEEVLTDVEQHEEGHWDIFATILGDYWSVINGRPDLLPAGATAFPLQTIKDISSQEWRRISTDETARHRNFHTEGRPVRIAQSAEVPVSGLDDIRCPAARQFVKYVEIGRRPDAQRSGRVTATWERQVHPLETRDFALAEALTGTRIRVEATADDGWEFHKWKNEASCPCANSNNPVCEYTVENDSSCHTEFSFVVQIP